MEEGCKHRDQKEDVATFSEGVPQRMKSRVVGGD